jgi:hypothetical protein
VDQRWRYAERGRQLRMLDEYPSGKLSFLFEVQPKFKVHDIWGFLDRPDSVTVPRLAILVYHFNSVNIPARQNRDKKPMFVDVVQNMYGPNGVIPSAIRAYVIKDKIAKGRAQVMNCGVFLSGAIEPTFKFFDGLSNRKFCAVTDDFRNHLLDGLEPRIVQSAIKVVDDISDQEGKVVERFKICELMYKAFCSELRVNLDPGSVSFMKRSDACFDIVDMSIGPFDL